MAVYFLRSKHPSRGKDARGAGTAANCAAERICDQRSGETYSYSGCDDVVHKEIVLPYELAGLADMDWTQDRATFWNAAEHAGLRRDTNPLCSTGRSRHNGLMDSVPRLYLFVPPEEKAEVEALGASWDAAAKCWYIAENEAPGKFSRWLSDAAEPDEADAEGYAIVSHEACVVATTTYCQHCGADIEVICIHCFGGTVTEEPLEQFTVSDIREMDEALTSQLALWPYFRRAAELDGVFANYCTRCGEPQDDMLLHSEPDQPFFDVPEAIVGGQVTCTPLLGTIRLSGDEHFLVD
jgi:hypothetical protein